MNGIDGFGVLMMFSWLLVVAGAVLLVIWAARAMPGRSATPALATPAPASVLVETPLDILSRRFAKGEINAEEFERGRDLLGGGPPKT